MNGKMKYVIDDYDNIMIFSPTVEHVKAANLLRGEVVGAGFVKMHKGQLQVFGESISCKVGNRGETDAQILDEKISNGQWS
jgi:hypothetical protein